MSDDKQPDPLEENPVSGKIHDLRIVDDDGILFRAPCVRIVEINPVNLGFGIKINSSFFLAFSSPYRRAMIAHGAPITRA